MNIKNNNHALVYRFMAWERHIQYICYSVKNVCERSIIPPKHVTMVGKYNKTNYKISLIRISCKLLIEIDTEYKYMYKWAKKTTSCIYLKGYSLFL